MNPVACVIHLWLWYCCCLLDTAACLVPVVYEAYAPSQGPVCQETKGHLRIHFKLVQSSVIHHIGKQVVVKFSVSDYSNIFMEMVLSTLCMCAYRDVFLVTRIYVDT